MSTLATILAHGIGSPGSYAPTTSQVILGFLLALAIVSGVGAFIVKLISR